MDKSSSLCAVFRCESVYGRHCKKISEGDSIIEKYRNEKWCIKVFNDFSANEVAKKLKSFETDPTLNCFNEYKFVFIAHGGFIEENRKNFIFGSDGRPLLIQQITDCFEDRKCFNLGGKMKFFEFYTCDFVDPQNGDVADEITGVIDDREKYKRDLVRDTIVMWSTISGFVSYRSPKEGTPFIAALCKKLQMLSRDKEITEILRIVQTEVDSHEEKDGSIKVTEIQTIRFDKLFYFHPELVIADDPEKKWAVYELDRQRKRLCLIINIKNFHRNKYQRRDGSEKDVENIEQQFSSLGFDVLTRTDLKQSEIVKEINNYTNKYEDVEAFALFLMSHGGKRLSKNVIYGYDCSTVTIDKIINLFKDNECPQLKNVPKFIFVVACRGDSEAIVNEKDRNSHSRSAIDGTQPVDEEFKQLDPVFYTDSTGRKKRLPPTRDLLLLWSRFHTAPMREMIAGSIFSNYLFQNLVKFVTDARNLEIMQVPRYVDGICKTIGVRKQYIDLNAIGLRKFLYPLRIFQNQFEEDEYKLTARPRGFLLIINNKFFQNHPRTAINSNDYVGYFKQIFSLLQFDVIEESSVDSILERVQRTLRDPKIESHDAFFLIISTEMLEENGRQFLIGCNGKKCDVENIKELFNENNCPTLKNKPKIIFLWGSNELDLYDERSEEEIAIREKMEQIFEPSLDLRYHSQSGCLVNFYTPFATFITGNCYVEQRSHLVALLSNINNSIEPAFRNVAFRQNKIESAAAEATESKDISLIIGRVANVTAKEQMKDFDFYYGEAIFKLNKKLHRSSKSQPKPLTTVHCFCEWTEEDNVSRNRKLIEEDLD